MIHTVRSAASRTVTGAIDAELARLRVSEPWRETIAYLTDCFAELPCDDDDGTFDDELLAVLRDLTERPHADEVATLFARAVARLPRWTLRYQRLGPDGPELWNPLRETISTFRSRGGTVRHYRADGNYPPIDLVEAWICHCLARHP